MAKQRQNTDETWAEILRQAVRANAETRYAFAKRANIGETQLARFMGGAGLSLTTAEKIGRAIGLTIKPASEQS